MVHGASRPAGAVGFVFAASRIAVEVRRTDIPVTYDIIRHKTKGALAHHVTLTGDMDEGLALIREALDVIEYW